MIFDGGVGAGDDLVFQRRRVEILDVIRVGRAQFENPNAMGPVWLISKERKDDGRDSSSQACGCGASTAMMNSHGALREEPLVRSAMDDEEIGALLTVFLWQLSPTSTKDSSHVQLAKDRQKEIDCIGQGQEWDASESHVDRWATIF